MVEMQGLINSTGCTNTIGNASGDIHGKIVFQGSARNSIAKFVKICADNIKESGGNQHTSVLAVGMLQCVTPVGKILHGACVINQRCGELYELLAERWKLPRAKLLVSVIGDLQDESDIENLERFKAEIRSISQTAGAWIVTSGLHNGIAQYVGDALYDESNPVTLGIAPWGIIEGREKFTGTDTECYKNVYYKACCLSDRRSGYLDPNHYNFLFIDDSNVDQYDMEMEFRAKFEAHIVGKENTPYVLIISGGGVQTFHCIVEAILRGDKVVLIPNTGGMADWIKEIIENFTATESNVVFEKQLKAIFGDEYVMKLNLLKENKDLFVLYNKEPCNTGMLTSCLMNAKCKEIDSVRTANYFKMTQFWDLPY